MRERAGAAQAAGALLRRVPTAAWLCALVATLNCAAWSILTPPFHVPDEPDHYAYVERLATTGRPPAGDAPWIASSAEQLALARLKLDDVRFNTRNGTIWTQAEQTALERGLARRSSRSDGTGASLAGTPQPPLYYALAAVPYLVVAGDTPLQALGLMRLLSALLGGVTVLLVHLFLREALPAHPWTWTVGALGVAFQPLFAFISGGLNPDALLFTSSAALFLLLARAFRRGLTTQLAVAVGAVVAIGFLTKLNFIGLLPGALGGVLVVALRQEGGPSLRALRLPGVVLSVAALPILLDVALNVAAWNRPAVGATSGAFAPATDEASIGQALNYLSQFYVVRPPGAPDLLSSIFPLRDAWIHGLVGYFGWIDTEFRPWVYDVAMGLFAVGAALVLSELLRRRAQLRARWLELGVYASMAAGLMGLVGLNSYNLWVQQVGGAAQARYLLPLLPLYGGAVALATRGAGRRWAPAAGTALVVLAIAHSVFSQLLVIARYYA